MRFSRLSRKNTSTSEKYSSEKILCYRTNLFSVKRTISFFLPLFQILSILTRPFSSSFSPIFSPFFSSSGQLLWDLRSAIWKLRGSFFLPFFRLISTSKGVNRKERANKDKMWKKWNDAEISVAFSALKCPFYAVLLRFASALAKVNAQQEKKDKEGKKEISYGFPVHLELPVHP